MAILKKSIFEKFDKEEVEIASYLATGHHEKNSISLPKMKKSLINKEQMRYGYGKWLFVQSKMNPKLKKIVETKKTKKEAFDDYLESKSGDITDGDHLTATLFFWMQGKLVDKINETEKKRKVYPSQIKKWAQAIEQKVEKARLMFVDFKLGQTKVETEKIFTLFPYLEVRMYGNVIYIVDDLITLQYKLGEKITNKKILTDILEIDEMLEKEVGICCKREGHYLINRYHKPAKQNTVDVGMMTAAELVVRYNTDKKEFQQLDGRAIPTIEGLTYQVMENVRRSVEERKERMAVAYEMFKSTMSIQQEKMVEEMGLVLLEGEEFYYFASTTARTSYICRFKKSLNGAQLTTEKMKGMCIHPDSHIPVFDGLATINLHLMSGEETYVTKNSNLFEVSDVLKVQIETFFEKMRSFGLSFNGMDTIKQIYA